MKARLSVHLLGPFQATLKGEAVANFDTAKARALLAYLAVEADRPHQRGALAEMLWPDRPEGKARANLRHTLAGLRRTIGDGGAKPPFLLVTRRSIQFNNDSDAWVDVAEFKSLADQAAATGCLDVGQLEKAASLYRGAFLQDLPVKDSAAFEEWALLRREQLSRQALIILDRLAEWHRKLGACDRALAYARQRVALEPWDEAGQRQLMRLLAYSDQRAAALAQYEACRQVLAQKLGIEPEEGTTSLYERIRDEGLEPPTPTPGFLHQQAEQPEEARASFVARGDELANLSRFLDLALDGRGQVVFVSGEAGSGKTALVQAFAREAQQAHPELVVAGGNGVAYTGLGDPYHPFREMIALLSGEVEARWRAGAMTTEHACRLWNALPLTAQALVVKGPDLVGTFVGGKALVERARACGPAEAGWLDELEALVEQKAASPVGDGPQQSALFGQYTRVVQTVARQVPLLLILDDLQWADVGSISLLFHMGREMAGSRILLVGAYRPEEVALGRGGERHPLEPVVNELRRDLGEMTVDLGRASGWDFVEALLDSESNQLGTEFRETLYQQTGGHPLFTVELLRGMEERGDLAKDREGQWVEGEALDWETLPARVEAVIAERVGRLPALLQETLAIASVEGEAFTAEVVAQAGGMDEERVVERFGGLDRKHRLVSSQGIGQAGGQRLSRYRFRHILFQRYAYSTLDPVRRAHLQDAVGAALEELYGDRADEVAVELAHHFQEAGNVGKAIEYLDRAGQRAAGVSANDEAIIHFSQALKLLETLPETPERAESELMLQVGLIVALQTAKGYGDPDAGRACARARELCGQMGETPQVFLVMWLLSLFYGTRGDHRTARELTQQNHGLAERIGDPTFVDASHSILGWNRLLMGDLEHGREHLERAMVFRELQQHRTLAVLFGAEPTLAALSTGSWDLWILGYPDQALECSRKALALAGDVAHLPGLAMTQGFVGLFHVFRRDAHMAQQVGEACIDLCTGEGLAYWLEAGVFCRGWALAEREQVDEGIALMRQGIAGYRMTGEIAHTQRLADLARICGMAGQPDDGLDLLDEALETVQRNGEHFYEAEIHRLRGELLLLQGADGTQAETCFQRAIELAQQQSARMWELRATASLCRLWQRQGKHREARKRLAQIYDWFSEGFDTPDLQQAQSLLEELA